MDPTSNKSEADDLNKTITNVEDVDVLRRSESPVFKCFNARTTRVADSSDYDIPSYQINQSQKSRTSSKCENDLVLPFSPVCSPIPVTTVQFQPPSIHSLGTIAKNTNNGSTKVKETDQQCAFQSLGMNDRDFSWVSSMASPPPKQLPGCEFNTIEKATFFPEEKFQNIQPRALFSPASDSDFGCQPITSDSDEDEAYKTNIRLSDVCVTLKQLEVKSLESDIKDDSDKIVYSPVIKMKKLSSTKKKRKDVLVKLQQDNYEFSVDDKLPNTTKDESTLIEDDSFQCMSFSRIDELCNTASETESKKQFYSSKSNAVFKVVSMDGHNARELECVRSEKSTMNVDKSVTDNAVRFDQVNQSKIDAMKRSHSEISDADGKSNEKKVKTVDDNWENVKEYLSESQLNVSDGEIFRTVENLEKTLASQESRDSRISGDASQEKTIKEESKCMSSDAHEINLKPEPPFFSSMQGGFSTASGTKLSVSEKHLTKAKQMLKECDEEVNKPTGFSTMYGKLIKVSDKALEKAKTLMAECEKEMSSNTGKEKLKTLRVSPDALEKAKAILEDCHGNVTIDCFELSEMDIQKTNFNGFQGFMTGLGKTIKVLSKSLEKAKALMLECEKESFESNRQMLMGETSTDSTKQIQISEEENKTENCDESTKAQTFSFWQPVKKSSKDEHCGKAELKNFNKFIFQGFMSGSWEQIGCLDEALKTKTITEDCENTKGDALDRIKCDKLNNQSFPGFTSGLGKQIKVSDEALRKAKAFMKDCEKKIELEMLELEKSEMLECKTKNLSFQGFSLGTGKQIKVSDEALKKGKALMEECDKSVREEIKVEKLKSLSFQGFTSGSGKQIKVSDEALQKGKALMKECEKKTESEMLEMKKSEKIKSKTKNLSFQGFSSGTGKQIKVSDEALKKGKALMKECEKTIELEMSEMGKCEKLEPKMKNLSFQGFLSCSGKEIKVSDKALRQAKSLMEKCSEETMDVVKEAKAKLNKSDVSEVKKTKQLMKTGYSVSKGVSAKESSGERGEETENAPNTSDSKLEEAGNATEDDWDEIIPSWLHVYNTSPSIVSERLELTPLISHENGNTSKPDREYIKSPVLGVGDRFYRNVKKRKLEFTEEPTLKSTTNPSDLKAPFKKAKLMEAVRVDVKSERRRMREQQEKAIKEKEKVKPIRGLLLGRKNTEKQMKWSEAVGNTPPEVHSEDSLRAMGVRENVLRVCIENATDFRFDGEDFFGSECHDNIEGVSIGDGCLVILDDENKFGVEELKRAFLASPGVQPNLLPSEWVENHYKWIVWKLAHYERSFPGYFAGRCLTPDNVALQVKYRYDREIDRNERSALKKILERDDTSVKRMVLCMCGIKKLTIGEASGYEITLTDGWYSCPARVDAAMTRLIEDGKLFVGVKLLIQGAVLINCEQGVSPLEKSGDVYLKISTNSTRRARWDTKLGFQKNPENFPISLGSILPQGGAISRLDVIIVRVYPVLYMEKTSDGYHVTRNRRSEEKAEEEYRRIHEKRMEKIWSEVQSEMRSILEKSKSDSKYSGGEQGEELSQLVGGCSDPIVLKNILSQEKRFSKEFSERVEKRLEKEKLGKRNVSEFLRVKIVDCRKPDYNNPGVLSVWNPGEDLIGFLSEGKVLSLFNIAISNSSKLYKSVQINTTRQTQFRPIHRAVKYPARKLTRLTDVSAKICPAFEEVDVVGMVAVIRDVSHGSRLSQVVYLTDLQFHFVGIVFWGSCRDHGWEHVLKIRSVVACSNLQWKKVVSVKEVPSLHVSENSVFTENPRLEYLKDEISRLKQTLPKDLNHFLSECEEKLNVKLEESKWAANRSSDSSKSRLSNGFESRPAASSTPIKALPVRTSTESCAEPSPIQKRIEKLQGYGEPPSLIPLIVRNKKMKKKS